MKRHTTNYTNTFIEVAEDCKYEEGLIPPTKGDKKSVANLQYDMLIENPYQYNSDEVLFQIYAERKDISKAEWDKVEQEYFSKGQPCFRASPLTKTYGWGVHHDENGKMALFAKGSKAYQDFINDDSIQKVKAMRNKRK